MRRIVTIFNILVALCIVGPSFAQSARTSVNANKVHPSTRQLSLPTLRAAGTISPIFLAEKPIAPLSQVEVLSNNFDTTENWYWYPARGMRIDTFQNSSNQTIIDTLYVMGMAQIFKSSLKRPYIDSVHMPIGVMAGDPIPSTNTLTANVMRVADQPSQAGTVLPWPDYSLAAVATAKVPTSSLTQELTENTWQDQAGNTWQNLVFNFGHHSLGTAAANKRFAVYVNRGGTDAFEDSLAFMVEANVADYQTGGTFAIDTDINHTFLEFQDFYQGYVTQQYWTNIQTAADPTQAFFGDLVMTVYLSDPTAGVADGDNAPMRLDQNFPNPSTFDGKTNIRFNLQGSREVSLKLYNEVGQELTTLVSGPMAAGPHTINLNVLPLANGTYYYTLRSGDFVATRSMIVHH